MNKAKFKVFFNTILSFVLILSLSACSLPSSSNGTTDMMSKASAEKFQDKETYYQYNRLMKEEQALYLRICKAIEDEETNITLENTDSAMLKSVVDAVSLENPNYYQWAYTFSWKGKGNTFELRLPYPVHLNMKVVSDGLIKKAVNEALEGTKGMDDFDKARHIHDYICQKVDYQGNASDQSIYGALVKHSCVCAGYARAFHYLCHEAGLRCYYVRGNCKALGLDRHAWNIVELDGKLYMVDVTWDDSINGYDYFAVPQDDQHYPAGISGFYPKTARTAHKRCSELKDQHPSKDAKHFVIK